MKTQTYNFRDFMNGTHEQPKKPTDLKAYSTLFPFTIPYILKAMFVHKGILIVGAFGAVAIGFTILETVLAKNGNEVGADVVSMVGKIVLPTVCVGFALITLVKFGGIFL